MYTLGYVNSRWSSTKHFYHVQYITTYITRLLDRQKKWHIVKNKPSKETDPEMAWVLHLADDDFKSAINIYSKNQRKCVHRIKGKYSLNERTDGDSQKINEIYF